MIRALLTVATARRATVRGLAVALLVLLPTALASAQRGQAGSPRRDDVRAEDGHPLALWSKRPAGRARGSILLLHGRTWSSLPNFDLRVPGQRVSMMDALVARGFAVYALDQRGYGATSRDTSGWLTPTRAARDARVALDWIASHERNAVRPVLFGYSQGSMTAMLTAQRDSFAMSALVLYGFPLDLSAKAATTSSAGQAERTRPERRPTTAAGAGEDFITPESTPPGVRDAYVRAATAADPVRADWRGEAEFTSLDPARLRVPTLLINGERDPYASRANLGNLMHRIAGVDHSWVVLGRSDHAAHLERQPEFVDALVAFLEQTGVVRSR